MNGNNISILVVIGVVLLFILFATIIRRYRRCPSDKILVVYGKTGGGSAKCIHGGGKFVWPVIQDYAYLSLTPISIDANLTNALSRQNIRCQSDKRPEPSEHSRGCTLPFHRRYIDRAGQHEQRCRASAWTFRR